MASTALLQLMMVMEMVKNLIEKMVDVVVVVTMLMLLDCDKANDLSDSSQNKKSEKTEPTLKVLVAKGNSRVVVAEKAVTWTVNDKIFGFYEKDEAMRQVVFQYKGQTKGEYIEFELISGTVSDVTNGTIFYMVYAPSYENSISNGQLTVNLTNQTGTLDQLGAYNYMYASGTVSGNTLILSFANQIALLKLHDMDFPNAVTTLTINGEQISDEATLDLKTGSWTLGQPSPLIINNAVEKNTDIYVAIFPCTSKMFVDLHEGTNYHSRSVLNDKEFLKSKLYGLDCSSAKCLADDAKWATDSIIYTPGQLRNFMSSISATNDYANKTVKVGADIAVADNWSYSTFGNFKGIFDGKDHTVSLNGTTNGPLFNEIGAATVKNIMVAGKVNMPYVKASISYTGGITGLMVKSESNTSCASLENCINKASVTSSVSTSSFIGGLAGKAEKNALIKDSTNEACVTCNDNASSCGIMVGGVAGQINGTIVDCMSMGDVTINTTCNNLYVGGIAGVAYGSKDTYISTIKGCSTANESSIQVMSGSNITDEIRAGGITGNGMGNLYACTNNSSISIQGKAKSVFLGGLSGHIGDTGINLSIQCVCNHGNISNTATISNNSNVGGLVGKLNLGNITLTGAYSVATSINDSNNGTKHVGSFVGNINPGNISLNSCHVQSLSGMNASGYGDSSSGRVEGHATVAEMQTADFVGALNSGLAACPYRFVIRDGDFPAIEKRP